MNIQAYSEKIGVIDKISHLRERVLEETKEIEKIIEEIGILDKEFVHEIALLHKNRNSLPTEEQSLLEELISARSSLSRLRKEALGKRTIDFDILLVETLQNEVEKGQVDKELQDRFVKEFQQLGYKQKKLFYDRIKSALPRQIKTVDKASLIYGALFEITRINNVKEQGLETLSEDQIAIRTKYLGFDEYIKAFKADIQFADRLPAEVKDKFTKLYTFNPKTSSWETHETSVTKLSSLFREPELASIVIEKCLHNKHPMEERKSLIESDVPIIRTNSDHSTLPYIYETKSYGRRKFGSLINNFNQLLKYNDAVFRNVVAGATIEINGLVDPAFLKWAAGSSIDEKGNIPYVEIIYNLPLPSKNEYKFVLKRGKKNSEGLRFINEYSKYTEEDKKIITGLQEALSDNSALKILFSLRKEDFSDEIIPFIANPLNMEDMSLFNIYNKERVTGIWKQLLQKGNEQKVNRYNKRNVFSTFATKEHIEKSLLQFQDYIHHNPEIRRVKESYIVPEEKIAHVIETTINNCKKIRDFEQERLSSEQEKVHQIKRKAMGYKGAQEGISLDVEHILMDAIQEVLKQNRSYTTPQRFKSVEEVNTLLEQKESERYVEYKVYDANSGEIKVYSGKKFLIQIEKELLLENIKRAEEVIKRLESKNERTASIHKNRSTLTRYDQELKQRKATYKTAEKELQTALKTIDSSHRNFEEIRTLATNYRNHELSILSKKLALLITIIGGEKEYKKFEKRIINIVDQEIVKFIYVVKADDTIVIQEEIVRGGQSGRSAHSELGEGRNVYGAGELVFSKHNKQFTSLEQWKLWNARHEQKNKPWRLMEINNGSGHYRPPSSTLQYVQQLLSSKNINTQYAVLNDTLMRGMNLKEVGLFE